MEKTARVPEAAEPPAAAEPVQATAPITVSGRATDLADKPVAGATIYLVSTNGKDAPLGTATTDESGSYLFRDARLPVSRDRHDRPVAGTFEVYGTAPGHGFAWHGMRHYQPKPRPADRRVAGEDYSLFQGEPLVMDLTFPPAATLRGRVVDEKGRPVADVKVKVFHCDYLDTKGKETHHNFREFWSLFTAPASLSTVKTDREGRFQLEGLPKEVGFLVYVEHPDYAHMYLYAATTERPATEFNYPRDSIVGGRPRPHVSIGDLNLTLRATRPIAVHTIDAETGRPAPNIGVSASDDKNSAYGTTDAEGKLLVKLPPGEYRVQADPPRKGGNSVRTNTRLTVAEEPAEQALKIRMNAGCVLILEAVDAETGRGVPDVTLMSSMDDLPGGGISVQSTTAYIDNPRTDADGRLRAVVNPGERTYSLGYIPESTGYRQQFQEKRVTLPAGETVVVRFELHK